MWLAESSVSSRRGSTSQARDHSPGSLGWALAPASPPNGGTQFSGQEGVKMGSLEEEMVSSGNLVLPQGGLGTLGE